MSAERGLDFLAGGGELGGLIRAKDWSGTPLGPVDTWPQSLRTAVSILLNSRYPMFIFWGSQLIKIYNDGYRPITGNKHPRVLGMTGPEVWPEIWADIGPMVERVMRDGEATWSEDLKLFMHRRGFAEEVYFTFSYSPIRDESGGIGGMFCACTETTAKVLGERRLKILRDLAAEPRGARTVEEARALSLAVLRANPADIAQVQIGDDGELALAPSPHLAFDDEYRGFFDLVRRQMSASVAAAGEVEAERRRGEALAEIDRAKTAFFSNVSHEFRTPLTLMLGPAEDGLADAEAPLPAAQRERFELIRRSGLRLQKLVNSLLDFARIEAGRANARYVPTDLAAFTRDVASSFRSAIEKAGLRFSVECPPLAGPAYVDREMWEKVVLNLLSNAFKATFEGEIRVSLRQEGERILLAVSDTGTGIPAAELPHVFERFRRVEGARSRTHEGSGIGLALVSELVRLHGGSVGADSRLGHGSTFLVSVPAGRAHLAADRIGDAPALAPVAPSADAFVEEALRWLPDEPLPRQPEERYEGTGPRARIVWADDNADMREYVRRLLAPRYDVTAVADGAAALAEIRARRPDLVLCDVMMPGIDGLGVVKALREDLATRSLPVILLSARSGEESRIEGYDAGANDYVYKPFTARELLARISARLELTRLEDSLVAERAALTSLFAQSPIPTAVLKGPDLVFEMCNPAYTAAVGGREVAGKPFLEALPEARGQGFDEQLRQVMRTGKPFIGQETLVRLQRGGTLADTYFTYVYAPLREADGRIERVIAIVNDVTEQVLARRRIEESEERYRRIFEAAGVSIWEEDFTAVRARIDGIKQSGVADLRAHLAAHPGIVAEATGLVRIVDVNEATLRMFGAATKEELMQSLDRVFVPETLPVFAEQMIALAEGRTRFEGEALLRALDGRPLHMLVNIEFPPAGAPADRVLATLTDITARKQAEERLARDLAATRQLQQTSTRLIGEAEPEALYEQIVAAAAGIMHARYATMQMLHPERGAKGELRLLAFCGFDPEVVRFWEWVRADSSCTCGVALRTGERVIATDVETADFMAQTEDRRALLAAGIRAAQSTPLVARDGSLLGMISTHWDRPHEPAEHELRLLDALARQAADLIERTRAQEKLREADRRKDEFLAVLSHELRNPLAPIRNAVTLLQEADGDPGIRGQMTAVLDRQVSHLIRLVDDLLDVARIGRGDIGLQKRVVDLAEIVAAAVETSRPRIESGGHRLSIELSDPSLPVFGDPVRLSQVVSNLLNNAAAYTPHGGRIELSARAQGGWACIAVRDNGAGIAAEALPSLFGMFSRGDMAKNNPSGFGIGLALARRLAEMHGGTIEASSAGLGQGSEFTVRLPLAAEAAAGVPGNAGTMAAPRRILVVDDNRDAANSLCSVLRVLGNDVGVAHDGQSALEAFRAGDPSVVILDIGMPGMDGYEVAREIRARFPERSPRLVALTGWGREADRRRAEEAGFDHHVVKPAEIAALRELLASLR